MVRTRVIPFSLAVPKDILKFSVTNKSLPQTSRISVSSWPWECDE